jgi:hypothetical protein
MAKPKPSIIVALASFAKGTEANPKQAAAAYTAISAIAREAAAQLQGRGTEKRTYAKE